MEAALLLHGPGIGLFLGRSTAMLLSNGTSCAQVGLSMFMSHWTVAMHDIAMTICVVSSATVLCFCTSESQAQRRVQCNDSTLPAWLILDQAAPNLEYKQDTGDSPSADEQCCIALIGSPQRLGMST